MFLAGESVGVELTELPWLMVSSPEIRPYLPDALTLTMLGRMATAAELVIDSLPRECREGLVDRPVIVDTSLWDLWEASV